MTSYSGYVEHSDFYIAPQSYQDAFDFLCQLAVESEEDVFYIGKVRETIDDFELYDVAKFKWSENIGRWMGKCNYLCSVVCIGVFDSYKWWL